MTINGRERRCKARTKAGKPCEAAPTAGGLCFFHGNPNKAVELGRKGGSRKHLSCSENPGPLPKLNTMLDVHDAAAQLFMEVRNGQVHPRVAAVLAQLLSVQLRAMGMKTEELLAQLEKGTTDRDTMDASDENLKLQAWPPATPVPSTTGRTSDDNETDTSEPRGGREEDE